jgi:Zn-dependent M28 family amino/carboxypeptidase
MVPQSSLTDFYKQIIEKLAADDMQGRGVSTPFETRAAEFILKHFSVAPQGESGLQDFTYSDPESGELKASKNVYCFVNNQAGKTIVIGAHYDHLGLGSNKSLSYSKQGQVHNGADDNASGIALMMGLYQHYTHYRSLKYNFLFVAYSAHEIGLYGSAAFRTFIESKYPPAVLVLNFDMVGRLDAREKIVAVYGYKSLAKYSRYFDTLGHKALNIRTDENEMIYQTDAGNFAKAGIAALSFTTGIHDDYHKVSDDAKYIDYTGIESIQYVLEGFLKTIEI